MIAGSHGALRRTTGEPHVVAAFEAPLETITREQQASLRPYAANHVSLDNLHEDTGSIIGPNKKQQYDDCYSKGDLFFRSVTEPILQQSTEHSRAGSVRKINYR